MKLVIDVGNTRCKISVFQCDELKELLVCPKNELLKKILEIKSNYIVSATIIASVASFTPEEEVRMKALLNPLFLNATTKVPFINNYSTPNTLGVDRIALASAAAQKYPNKNVLVIDAGTCITYEFINAKGIYFGGAISPGIQMRYKALHTFTAKLPLLERQELEEITGSTTESAMHSGVINGVVNEIDGVIAQYTKKYTDLTVVLTGGDTYFLAEQLKSGIFAQPNFILEGLLTILNYNLAND